MHHEKTDNFFQYISSKMQLYTVYLYVETALQHLVLVTPLWLIPDVVDTVVCAPDDGWSYHPKHVEQFPHINKLCNVASCWIYIGILLGAHYILHISRIRVKLAAQYRQFLDIHFQKVICPPAVEYVLDLEVISITYCYAREVVWGSVRLKFAMRVGSVVSWPSCAVWMVSRNLFMCKPILLD